ncbi:MAG: T9SS type A sorting domain-containing protein [Paludibacteraceae bacterium]|nr:T9SS type A sorting domain-containing protein [Paludibacteraceae bacterium]
MTRSSVRVLTLLLLSCFSLLAYAQDCCPVKEKVGKVNQYLYEYDKIEIDLYTDTNEDWLRYVGDQKEPQNWNYNKFIRVRAWSDRAENPHNYIQFYWWVGDGNNSSLTQTYANGIGPKAGTYNFTDPMMGAWGPYINGTPQIYYWTHTTLPSTQATLLGYRVHSYYNQYTGQVWVCPFSSYASNAGDLSNNNTQYVMGQSTTGHITTMNSYQVTVDVGDDGNIYIQVGGQDCDSNPVVTIGRKTNSNVHALSVSTEGNGTVTTKPNCENHIEGDKIILTPTPANSSVCFKEWTGTHAEYVTDNGDGTYSVTMQSEDMNLTAVFGDCVKEVTDIIDTCSAALPFVWRPWNNGGIEITSYAQNGTKDIVYQKGSTTIQDSIVTLLLILHEPQKTPVEVTDTLWQCDYDLGEGNWVNLVVDDYEQGEIELDIPNAIGTTYKTMDPDIHGCDSITVHEVIIIPEKVQRLFEFCQSDLNLGDNNYINLEIEPRLVLEGSFWGNFAGDSIIRDTTESTYCLGFDSITIDTIRIYPAYRETWNPGICADKMEEALAEGIPFYDLGPITDMSQNGMEYYTEGSIHGCDSVIVLDLTPLPNDTIYEPMSVCSYPITWRGKTYNSKEDTEKDPVIAPGKEKGDCRQYFFLVPEEAPAIETSIDSTICASALPFYWEEADLTFEEAGSKEHTFHTMFGGCDSIVTLNLNVLPSPEIVETRTICPEQLPYTWGEVVFTEAGTQTKTFERENACDSIVTYTIVVVPDLIQDGDTVCESQLSTPYTWEDETIAADDARFVVNETTGVKTLTIGPKVLPSSLVCDSTVQFTLTVIPEHINDSYTICESELPFTWKAGEEEIVINTASDAVNRSVTLPSVLGCDSTVHLNLTILPTARRGLGTVYIKTGNSFTVFEGTAYEQSFDTNGEYEVVGKGLSAVGCDSVVTFTLEVRDTEIENIYDAICEGEPYVWNGIECTQTDVYEYKTTTIYTGLDSIAYLHLTVNPKYDQLTDGKAICDSELPFTWEGETFTANDDYTDLDEQTRYREVTKNVQTKAGCDSIVTFRLTVYRTFNTPVEKIICSSELPYMWEGETFTEGGSKTLSLKTVHGCDSIVTMTLRVADQETTPLERQICESELPYTWDGEVFTEAGTRTKHYTSVYGCDSTVTYTLNVIPSYHLTAPDITVCENELPYRWGSVTFTEAGTQTQTFTSSLGCDSTVTLTLNVNPTYNETVERTVCQDALPYTWGDVTFTAAGSQTKRYQSVNGCDSTVMMVLNVQTPTSDTQTEKVCDNELPYQWNPTGSYTQALTESGTYNYTLKSSLGCDSVYYTMNFTVDRDYVTAQPAITLETCANDEAVMITLNSTAGMPAAYDIVFDEKAAAQGLENVSHQTIASDGIIAVPLPHNEDSTRYVRPDDYTLTLTVYDQCDRKTDYPLLFRILYPSWLIQQRWRDVMAIYNKNYNGGYDFSSIRWYKNGIEIQGKGVHNSYVQMSPVLEMATYYALVTRTDDGKALRTCDFVPNLASPYYMPDIEKIRLKQQTDSRHITIETELSGEYQVYDVTGKQVMTGYFGEMYGSPMIVFSPATADGAYILRFQATDGTRDTKKWLIR